MGVGRGCRGDAPRSESPWRERSPHASSKMVRHSKVPAGGGGTTRPAASRGTANGARAGQRPSQTPSSPRTASAPPAQQGRWWGAAASSPPAPPGGVGRLVLAPVTGAATNRGAGGATGRDPSEERGGRKPRAAPARALAVRRVRRAPGHQPERHLCLGGGWLAAAGGGGYGATARGPHPIRLAAASATVETQRGHATGGTAGCGLPLRTAAVTWMGVTGRGPDSPCRRQLRWSPRRSRPRQKSEDAAAKCNFHGSMERRNPDS